MTRLYISYDHEGFEAAKAHGTDEVFDSTHSIADILEQLISDANHDWFHGHCESYQIYNDKGDIVFHRNKSQELIA